MKDEELEASVRITEALLGRVVEGYILELRADHRENGDEVGKRIGELFKAVHRAVRARHEAS